MDVIFGKDDVNVPPLLMGKRLSGKKRVSTDVLQPSCGVNTIDTRDAISCLSTEVVQPSCGVNTIDTRDVISCLSIDCFPVAHGSEPPAVAPAQACPCLCWHCMHERG